VRSDLAAFAAVFLWGSLAALAVGLSSIPPLLMTGIGLMVGSLIALPVSGFQLKKIIPGPKILLVGVYGLFGYHAALFAGLQNAPSIQANLVNYLWPVLIVLLAPLVVGGQKLGLRHIAASAIGFSGAAVAILSGSQLVGGFASGYLFAFFAALIFSSYSLLIKRFSDSPTSAVGGYSFVGGTLAILAHFVFEQQVHITADQWLWLIALGLGPLGGSFYLWDYALKHGPAQRVGTIAFLTPVISTTLLVLASGEKLSLSIGLAALLIVVAAVLGSKVNN